MTTEILDEVRDLKTQAKNRRDDKLYKEGTTIANRAIKSLESSFESAVKESWRTELASELADCYGLIGGIQRRWGLSLDDPETAEKYKEHLQMSIDAYDKGHHFEQEDNYGVVNSYNLVNRLVGRILLTPDTDIKEEMKSARAIISDQLKQKRHGDIWALADKSLLQLLLGETEHNAAWTEFLDQSPPYYALESLLDTLEPLAACNFPIKTELEASIDLLEDELEKL
ncbi:MAG: hypothetical protein N0E44_22170 [Candidatus Thiodiazotropha lotti]|nr:hypothetical protein [Candidatus Thiodiazotropha lotti]MCW4222580.1 hypothetical protein [Candidatus Thiodiazotropha lotti]